MTQRVAVVLVCILILTDTANAQSPDAAIRRRVDANVPDARHDDGDEALC